MHSVVFMFLNLGGGEVVFIMLIILLLFGSKKIPELARGLGKGMREFKDATNNIQREIQSGANSIENEAVQVVKEKPEEKAELPTPEAGSGVEPPPANTDDNPVKPPGDDSVMRS